MGNIKLSISAKEKLNEVTNDFRNEIIKRLSANDDVDEITEYDVERVRDSLFTYEFDNNLEIKKLIKRKRRLALIAVVASIQLFVFTLFVFVDESDLISMIKIDHFAIIFSLIAAVFSLILSFYVRMMIKKVPDKRDAKIIYLEKWNYFESLLKQRFEQKEKKKRSSFIDLVEMLLDRYDEEYTNKPFDFNRVLDVRNKIVHNDGLDKLSINDINEATQILERLIKSVKKDMMS